MKRIALILSLCFCAGALRAQIPMPRWVLSDAFEAQCGVAVYTNEMFDFKRLPMPRRIADFLSLRDTVSSKKYIYRASVCDAQGVVAQVGFQQDGQVSRSADTVALYLSAANPWLKVSLGKYLPVDASDDEIARTLDELRQMRPSIEQLDSAKVIRMLPAGQNASSYALQYLFARNGIDASEIFSWRTILPSSEAVNALMDYCCDKVAVQKIGSNIERFARKAKFSEEYIYVCEGFDNPNTQAVMFFLRDGKFWTKVGMSQYTTYDSVISVWRHQKKATRIAAYKLKDRFL